MYETFQGFLRDGKRNARHYIQKNELRVNFLERPRRVCCRKRKTDARVGVAVGARRAARVVALAASTRCGRGGVRVSVSSCGGNERRPRPARLRARRARRRAGPPPPSRGA